MSVGVGSAFAEDQWLQAGAPIADQGAAQTPVLKGSVDRRGSDQGSAGTAEHSNQLNAEIKDNKDNPDLSKLSPRVDSPHFNLSARKMSAQDFRDLNYGVLGIVSFRTIFSAKQTVTEVFPGCPAALAGIRPGDVEVQTDDHVWNRSDNQRSSWNITDGEAGTPVDLTIRRHGQLITFHLIRMNIEDIQNDRIRRMFEKMLRKFGPPTR